jgi:hypothetical protein
MSGKLICIPWEKVGNECPIDSCKENNRDAKFVEMDGSKCCEIATAPEVATNYTIIWMGPKKEILAQTFYSSPPTRKISLAELNCSRI